MVRHTHTDTQTWLMYLHIYVGLTQARPKYEQSKINVWLIYGASL